MGEMLTDKEIVDHVEHMGCEEMDVELIEDHDDDIDMGPSKMTLVECGESLKALQPLAPEIFVLGTNTYHKSNH